MVIGVSLYRVIRLVSMVSTRADVRFPLSSGSGCCCTSLSNIAQPPAEQMYFVEILEGP